MLSYIELNAHNIIHNFRTLTSLLHEKTIIMSVVKGNAYGHGQAEVVRILAPYTDWFAAINMDDLRMIRSITTKPLFIMGYIMKDDLEELISADASLVVYDTERMQELEKIGQRLRKPARVHIKVDAALGRQGLLVDKLEPFMRYVDGLKHIRVEGVCAHFANIEDTRDFSHAQKQIDLFKEAVAIVRKHGYPDVLTHISSTAGSMVYEKDLNQNHCVRLGIGLYGMWPSEYLQEDFSKRGYVLKPAMRWVTHVAQVKTVPAGYSIGYGLTYITSTDTRIAVVPQGYSDGYDRGLSNKGCVLIKGVRCPVLGRVAMNMFVVDVSQVPDAKAEDEVVLLGSQGAETITAEEIAGHIDTINYEVTTRISPLIARFVK